MVRSCAVAMVTGHDMCVNKSRQQQVVDVKSLPALVISSSAAAAARMSANNQLESVGSTRIDYHAETI